MKSPRSHLLAICAAALATVAFAQAAPAAHPAAVQQEFRREFGENFLDAWWAQNPDDAILAGYYRYADRVIAPDRAAAQAASSFARRWLARLARYPAEKLDADARTDRAVIQNNLEALRWYADEFRAWEWDPSDYNVADPIALLLDTGYAPLERRLRTVHQRIRQVPAYYAAARASIGNPTREHTALAIEQNQGALAVLGEDLEKAVAGSGLGARERAQFLRDLGPARTAVQGYIDWLKQLDAAPERAAKARSFRIGQALYEKKFGYDIQSSFSAPELYRRALAEKERLHAQMDQLAAQLWPKYFPGVPAPADRLDRIGQLIGKLSDTHVKQEDFASEVKALIPRLEAWVRDKDLLSQDPEKPLVVRDTPVHKRGFAIASIDAPGPYNPSAATYFNVSPLDALTPEQAESFLREYNHWILQVLTIHEAVPGHYLQLVHSNKSPSLIKRVFGSGPMIEGWAVYSERMLLESGWGDNAPEMWLMYAKWNLRVVCNTILDYSVHTLGMSREQALHLLTREAFQSDNEATGKWRRATLSSVQLTSYFSGYAEIYDFREQLKREQGAGFRLKDFHEQFLSYGSAPVSVIRALMAPQAVGVDSRVK